MNSNTKLARVTSAAKFHAVSALALVATVPGLAMAQGGDFDPASVTAKITTYVAAGVVILAAMALGRWTLKALGIIGGR